MRPVRAAAATLFACSLTFAVLWAAQASALPAQLPSNAPVLLGQGASARSTGHLIVKMKGAKTAEKLRHVYASADTSAGAVSSLGQDQLVWRTPRSETDTSFAKDLVASGQVEYAVPDYVRELTGYTPPAYPVPPNDWAVLYTYPMRESSYKTGKLTAVYPNGTSWGLRDINAFPAWQTGFTGPNIIGKYPLRAASSDFKVAVIDSGLYSDHEDIAGSNVIGRWDFFSTENADGSLNWDASVTPVDPSYVKSQTSLLGKVSTVSHGTCVAGEIGALANNGVGTVGDTYDGTVLVYKVMGINHNGAAEIRDTAVINAIKQAVADGCKVINMSFTGPKSPALQTAIDNAYNAGCVLVAAKGNDGNGALLYPGACNHVISVGALAKNAKGVTIPASFSSYYRTRQDIMAPGSAIWGLIMPGYDNPDGSALPGYNWWDGTSMASPLVAGAISNLWRAAPQLTNAEITAVVLGSATKKGATTHYPSGYRALNMLSAYRALQAQYPLLVKPALADQTVASLGHVTVDWHLSQGPLRAVTYDVTVNSAPLETGTSAGGATYAWAPGDYSVGATAHSSFNWDDGTAVKTATVHVVPLVGGASSWLSAHAAGSSAMAITSGYRQPVAIDGVLGDASGTPVSAAAPRLETSTNGVTFTDAGTSAIAELPGGTYRAVVAPDSRAFYRFSFAGAGGLTGSVSSAVRVTPGVSLATPYAKASVSHAKSFSASGKLRPAHNSSSRTVRLRLKRWSGGAWRDYKNVWTRVTYKGSYSTYSASLKLPKGTYRIYANAPADALHSDTTSGYVKVVVK